MTPTPPPINYASPMAPEPSRIGRRIFAWVLFILLAIMLFVLVQGRNRQAQHIPFSDFDLLLRSGSVSRMTLQGDEVSGDLTVGTALPGGRTITQFRTEVPIGVGGTWQFLEYVNSNRHGATVEVENSQNLLTQVLVPLIPWLLIFVFLWFFVFRQLRNAKLQSRQPMPVVIVNQQGGQNV
jgi:ATP-dependent Zn protease